MPKNYILKVERSPAGAVRLFMEKLYYCLWYFFIFAFLGWCMEVAYAAVKSGRFVNRGFDNGPVCPIYGYGVVLVYLVVGPLRDKWLTLFLASAALTTGIELVTGFVLDKVFHNKWWDYSKQKFNIGGYVCLLFSLIWGVLCTAVVKLTFNPIGNLIAKLPRPVGYTVLGIFLAIHLVDTVVSVSAAFGFSKRLDAIQKLGDGLHRGSDAIGEKISSGTLTMYDGLENLSKRSRRAMRRLLDAFPTMNSKRHGEALIAARQRLAQLRAHAAEKAAERKAERRKAKQDKKEQRENGN